MKVNYISARLVGHSHTFFRALTRLLPHQAFRWAALVVALAIVASEPSPIQAATSVTEAWVHRFSNVVNNSDDRPLKIVRDGAGDIIVIGNSNDNSSGPDMLTIKYSGADGSVLWQQRRRYTSSSNGRDHGSAAVAVAVDANDNVVVTGSAFDDNQSDYYTAKYAAADGALLWEKRRPDEARAVAVDGSGNVVVTGSTGTLKLAAADGALLWLKPFVSGSSTAVRVDGSGNVLVTGESFKGTTSAFYTAKYAAADGALIWEKSYNESARISNLAGGSHSLALGLNGLVAITGRSILKTTGAEDVLTVVYREGLSAVAIEPVPSGVRLSSAGTAGQSYSIQRAPAVTGPWSTLATPTAPLNGLIEYFDTAPPSDAAFYRTSAP